MVSLQAAVPASPGHRGVYQLAVPVARGTGDTTLGQWWGHQQVFAGGGESCAGGTAPEQVSKQRHQSCQEALCVLGNSEAEGQLRGQESTEFLKL